MVRNTRRRSAAQRQLHVTYQEDNDNRPLTEEVFSLTKPVSNNLGMYHVHTHSTEQEIEILSLRQKNDADMRNAHFMLDTLVLICIIISGHQTIRYIDRPSSFYLVLVTIVQTFLLPISLSPDWLPRIAWISEQWHTVITFGHLALFMVAFVIVRRTSDSSVAELLRWALPELIAGAVEIQRKCERENAGNLEKLEKLKYNLKGA